MEILKISELSPEHKFECRTLKIRKSGTHLRLKQLRLCVDHKLLVFKHKQWDVETASNFSKANSYEQGGLADSAHSTSAANMSAE